jgi:hypothetical protein
MIDETNYSTGCQTNRKATNRSTILEGKSYLKTACRSHTLPAPQILLGEYVIKAWRLKYY